MSYTNYAKIIISLTKLFSYFCRRKNRRFLTYHQYHELKDTRFILGTIVLFYVTNILPFYVSFCHILLYTPSYAAGRFAQFGLVVNSSFKFFIYIALSRRFRLGFLSIFNKDMLCDNKNDDELVKLKPRKRQQRKKTPEGRQ